MNENRNLLLAVLLSAAVLVGWEYFIARPQLQAQQATQAQQALLAHQEKKQSTAANMAAPQAQAAAAHLNRDQALKLGGARIAIDTPTVDGSLLLKGAR